MIFWNISQYKGSAVFFWFILFFQRDQMLLEDVLPVQEDDSLMSSHPIVVTVTTPAEITSVFDGISYSKVGKIWHCCEHLPVLWLLVNAKNGKNGETMLMGSRKQCRAYSGCWIFNSLYFSVKLINAGHCHRILNQIFKNFSFHFCL